MRKINKDDFEKIKELQLSKKVTVRRIMKLLDISFRHAEIYKAMFDNPDELKLIFANEIVGENVRLAKEKQEYQDSNRIERKSFRNQARFENAITALNRAVLDKFEKIDFEIKKALKPKEDRIYFPKVKDGEPNANISLSKNQAIIQLSDTHFNELVDLKNNRYDFDIASKRMKLYADEIKKMLKSYNVEKVILAMTGDLINSDRRLDEKLNMATNRMTAAMISVNLIQYFIQDLMEEFDQMDVVYVTGNESRSFEYGFSDIVVTDNYDSVIFNMLKLVFNKSDCVKFIDTNPVETIICVNEKNILLTHGTHLGQATQGNIQKLVGKYASNGTTVDYVLFGHIHSAYISDNYARSSSLVGENTYSSFGLNFASKASQNLHLIKGDGTIHNFRIELQNTEGVMGYAIQSELEAYNAKSASKVHQEYEIVKI